MLALIRKDLIAGRVFFVLGLVVYALYALTAYRGPIEFLVLNIVTVIALGFVPMFLDDKYGVDELVLYLPASRAMIVRARYLMCLLALIGGMVLFLGVGLILEVLFGEQGFAALFSVPVITIFCAVPVALFSLYLPCCFRYGLSRGSFAFSVLVIVLTIVVVTVIQVTGFDISAGLVIDAEMAGQPAAVLAALVDRVAESMGEFVFYAVAVISGIALAGSSLVLSTRFFERCATAP